jgi:3-oxoacyl-[acyl-carrier protein] reductase
MDLDLKDRVYIVTGGAKGLGRATVDALVADGARVVVSGRSAESLAAAKADLGDAVVTVEADNGDPGTPARLIAAAREGFGRLDGALISVGGPPTGTVSSTSDADWETAFGSVFLGAVRIAREVCAALEPGGSVAFVLSSSVRAPIPGLAISNGLRPGLAMVAKTLADEQGPRGIRVNGLLPGRVGTERVAELDASTGDAEAAKAKSLLQIPLGRYGEPEEFGRAAAFLLSPASSYVTGVMLPVDGGMLRTV